MDIDVNQLANSLNAKIDLPQGLNQSQIDYVVEYQMPTGNNSVWYRKYKSGWLEQGCYTGALTSNATFTFNFPKPYKALHSYFITATGINATAVWEGGSARKTDSCVIKNSGSNNNYIDIYTCGQGA